MRITRGASLKATAYHRKWCTLGLLSLPVRAGLLWLWAPRTNLVTHFKEPSSDSLPASAASPLELRRGTPSQPQSLARRTPKGTRKPLAPASARRPLWELEDGEPAEPAFPIPRVVRQLYPVRLHPERLSGIRVGDRIPMALPGLGSREAVVDLRVVSPNGDRSWSGHLEVGGDRYLVVYTQGDRATFATVTTPQGTYALEGLGSSGNLFLDNRDELIDTTQPDTLLPHR